MHVDMTKKTNFAIENTSKRRISGAIMEFRVCINPPENMSKHLWNGYRKMISKRRYTLNNSKT